MSKTEKVESGDAKTKRIERFMRSLGGIYGGALFTLQATQVGMCIFVDTAPKSALIALSQSLLSLQVKLRDKLVEIDKKEKQAMLGMH